MSSTAGEKQQQQQVVGSGGRKSHSPSTHQLMDTVEMLDRRHDSVNGKEIIVRTTTTSVISNTSTLSTITHQHNHHHPTRTRSSSLSGRSLRRRIISDPKYHKLESGAPPPPPPTNKSINGRVDVGIIRLDDEVDLNSARSFFRQHRQAKKNSVMGDIIDNVKRGMSTFSLPRLSKSKNNPKKLSTNESEREKTTLEKESILSTVPPVVKSKPGNHNNKSETMNRDLGTNGKERKSFWEKNRKNRRGAMMISASTTDIRSASNVFSEMNPVPSPGAGSTNSSSSKEVSTCSSSGSNSGAEVGRNKLPGITGLRNHGNTCYMNAVLQCLCHTDNLARYFVMDRYKVDLSRRNKYNAKKFGTKGEVTEQLALLFKSLWSSQYTPDISNQFRNVVGKYASQYESGNQQDAQEFLLWLLDKVHEDLNTATKKKYKKVENNVDKSEEDLAADALANYTKCNNSFIHDLFQAQYRSTLTCPACEKQSITFDPFLCISTPIPQRQLRPIKVTVVYQDQNPKEVKIGLRLNIEANIKEVREMVATDTSIPEDQIVLVELYQDNFGRVLKDSDHISAIQDTPVYAIEIPSVKSIPDNQEDQQPGTYLLILGLNKLGYGNNAKRFGGPFAIRVHRETNYCDLQAAVFKGMANILKPHVTSGDQKELDSIIRFRVVDGIPGKCYLPDDVQLPLFMPTVDQAISHIIGNDNKAVDYLKISVEWDADVREKKVNICEEVIEEHHTVTEMKNQQDASYTATLGDCFDLYTQEEKLELENKWLCPACKRPQQGVKKLSLWSIPDILVIHLKRFRHTNTQRTKLDTLVDFPIQDFNMSPHLVNRHQNGHLQSNGTGVLNYWSPWKQHHRTPSYRSDNQIFDLYAICNHHGSMQSGHYTAYCKNPIDGLWYHFDDTTVKLVEESQIVTTSAYILFYQRKSHSSGGSSSESSSCATWPDHWAYSMPQFHFIPPKTSKSHDNLFDLDYGSKGRSSTLRERTFLRGGRKYSTLGHLTGRRPSAQKHQDQHKKEHDEYLSELERDTPTPTKMPESRV